MANQMRILSGTVYAHGTITPVSNVTVNVENLTKKEQHSGSEALFPELVTNVMGEFQVNLANFTKDNEDGDVIQFTLNYEGTKDLIQYTLTGDDTNTALVLTTCPEHVYTYERYIDEIGDKVTIQQETSTVDEDYGSVSTETITNHSIIDDTYCSIQISEDEEEMMEQGVVSHGLADGYFKVRYNVKRDMKVSYNNEVWKIIDKPVRRSFKNSAYYDVARMVRLS